MANFTGVETRIFHESWINTMVTLIASFMGPTWGPSVADRTQVGPMLAPWTLPSEYECPDSWRPGHQQPRYCLCVIPENYRYGDDGILATIHVNTLGPRQNGRYFADDIFKYIFLNKICCNFSEISLKFIPKGSINNKPALVQIMAWCQTGDKPLSEPMTTFYWCMYPSLGLNELISNGAISICVFKYVS